MRSQIEETVQMALPPDEQFDAGRQFNWVTGITAFSCLSFLAATMIWKFVGPKVPIDYWPFLPWTLIVSSWLAVCCGDVFSGFLITRTPIGQAAIHPSDSRDRGILDANRANSGGHALSLVRCSEKKFQMTPPPTICEPASRLADVLIDWLSWKIEPRLFRQH
jgi:hypothetical protein